MGTRITACCQSGPVWRGDKLRKIFYLFNIFYSLFKEEQRMSMKRAMMIGLDGADPVVCKRLVAEGRMPNLKKILECYYKINNALQTELTERCLFWFST